MKSAVESNAAHQVSRNISRQHTQELVTIAEMKPANKIY